MVKWKSVWRRSVLRASVAGIWAGSTAHSSAPARAILHRVCMIGSAYCTSIRSWVGASELVLTEENGCEKLGIKATDTIMCLWRRCCLVALVRSLCYFLNKAEEHTP